MRHLAVIPDGGGRWAFERGLLRVNGYVRGTEAITDIIDAADELNLKFVTFYASSLENMQRGEAFSLSLSSVYVEYLTETLLPIAEARGYKMLFVGDFKKLTPELMACISRINAKTINNKGLTVSFVFAYDEMEEVAAAFNYVFTQKLLNADYTEASIEEVERYMYSAALPPVDAVIRYGGFRRFSGFLPFRTAYAELFFSDKLFPDASKGDIYDLMKAYKRIKRKFGRTER